MELTLNTDRSFVKCFYIGNVRELKKGTDKPEHEPGVNIRYICIDPADNIAFEKIEAFPQVFPFTAIGPALRENIRRVAKVDTRFP